MRILNAKAVWSAVVLLVLLSSSLALRQAPLPVSNSRLRPNAASAQSAVSHRTYLPILGKKMDRSKDLGPPAPTLSYTNLFDGPSHSMVTEDNRIYRDESGQLVVMEWSREGGLRELGRGPVIGDMFSDLLVEDGIVYAAVMELGLYVFDANDPEEVRLLGQVQTGASAHSLAIDGDTLYIGAGKRILSLDVSEPIGTQSPEVFTADLEFDFQPFEMRANGGQLYVFSVHSDAKTARIFRLDAAEPVAGRPLFSGDFQQPPLVVDMAFHGSRIYIASFFDIYALDIDGRGLLEFQHKVELRDASWRSALSIREGRLFSISEQGDGDENMLAVYDLSEVDDPANANESIEPVKVFSREPIEAVVLGGFGWVGDALVLQYGAYQYPDQYNARPIYLPVFEFADDGDGLRTTRLIGAGGPHRYFHSGSTIFHLFRIELLVAGDNPWRVHVFELEGAKRTTLVGFMLDESELLVHVDEQFHYIVDARGGDGSLVLRAYANAGLPERKPVGEVSLPAGYRSFATEGDQLFVYSRPLRGSEEELAKLLVFSLAPDRILQAEQSYHIEDYFQNSNKIWVNERFIIFRSATSELLIYDRTVASGLNRIGVLDMCVNATATLDGSVVYCYSSEAETLRLVDITSPASPVILAERSLDTERLALSRWETQLIMQVEGDRLYLAAAGLMAVDISDPTEPVLLATLRGLPLFERPISWIWHFSQIFFTEGLILAPVVETHSWGSLGLAQIEWDR